VLLKTSVGDIDIELWSREAPKACRNFVQLCMEGYYNNTIIHRVVKGFIAQGGDPTGTGTGGESIYGKPFKDEIHSRLRFVRRGLVAMANAGKDDNGSQFFFTLAATPELNSKHTIFGKVAGDTIYNMIKLDEIMVDHFTLSPGKSKSTHDVLQDPKLSKVPAVEGASKESSESDLSGDENQAGSSRGAIDAIKSKLKSQKSKVSEEKAKSESSEEEGYDFYKERRKEKRKKLEELRSEYKSLKTDMKQESKKKKEEKVKEELENEAREKKKEDEKKNEEYFKEIDKYKQKVKEIPKKGTSREELTASLLAKFREKLISAKEGANDNEDDELFQHELRFESNDPVLAKDANLKNDEWFDISDPRSAINKRKREASQKLMAKFAKRTQD
ncbi:spliceosome-associated protein CWC27 homolog, partial [Diaphorina citri]|uniref:Spliceosome-associated protein CWC27 homolog n=1 Tax=Diaphorina citri TaxID=121845 RepID=A0A1S3CVG6_DIACI